MTPYLVDSNIIIDVITEDAKFLDWSANAMKESAQSGMLCINPIIFAEVSIGFSRREDVTEALDALDFEYADLPWDAAFVAGKAFIRAIGGMAACGARRYRISTSAPMPWYPA